MAPSIAARYLTRGLARAANHVHNKETSMAPSIAARYLTRGLARAANNVRNKETAMAPSIAARYLTRGLARAANNVHNKETAMRASVGARYITRRQLSSGEILSHEGRAANNVHTMETPKIIGDSEGRRSTAVILVGGIAAYFAVVVWHALLVERLGKKYGFRVRTSLDGTYAIEEHDWGKNTDVDGTDTNIEK